MISTRFAPSPTGHLHIGGARVALFCWLFAKHHKGRCYLRIEDTDRTRSTEDYSKSILESLDWLELDFEGPIYQSHRLPLYKTALQQLMKQGLAYKCYCSKDRLQKLREEQIAKKQKPHYDGHCRTLKAMGQGAHVIRFKNPQEGTVTFEDAIHSTLTIQNTELDDLIIFKEDGFPTYNFAAVIDDLDMKITHVIRGDDHLTNTFKQINLMKALSASLPTYAHVPMILGQDGQRLSKRHGATSILEYRSAGYLQDALLNYLVRLGWSQGDQEIFTRSELIELFDIQKISKSAATFNPEKLLWLNQHYLKNTDSKKLVPPLHQQFIQMNIDDSNGPPLEEVIPAQCERAKTLLEIAEKSRYFYQDAVSYEPKAAKEYLKQNVLPPLQKLQQEFSDLSHWEEETLHQSIVETAEQFKLKLAQLAQPIRVAMTGGTISPPIGITLQLIGRTRVLLRLDQAINWIEEQGSSSF